MHIIETAFARGRIAQMSHVNLTHIRNLFLGIGGGYDLIANRRIDFPVNGTEDFRDSPRTHFTFAEEIFFTRLGLHFQRGETGTFLSAIVLFFHQEVEFIQPIHPCAILFLIVLERF